MGILFGTDGVRGIANKELTPELAFKIGMAGAKVLTRNSGKVSKILVGKDTRLSGDMLEASLVAGFCSVGADVYKAGVLPTPAIAYLTKIHKMDAGVVISASHNSMEYNGIKFFDSNGYKLSDEIENEIEDYVLNGKEIGELPTGKNVGCYTNFDCGVDEYVNFLASTVDCDLTGMKIAIDCANGAAFTCAEKLYEKLGVKASIINDKPDGININYNCGSTHMSGICDFVSNGDFDIGFAFDGDADRLLAVDENGKIVDGDKIMFICANNLKKQGKLKSDTVVATVMSNLGFFNSLRDIGIKYEQTKVGDRYVLENMLKNSYNLGGEQSGHIIFFDYNTTGDGLISSLQLACALRKSNKKLSELADMVAVMPQVLKNAKIKNEHKSLYMNDRVIAAEIKRIEDAFMENGRVLIRPSGTEPLVRVMLEGDNINVMEREAEKLALLIEKRLG